MCMMMHSMDHSGHDTSGTAISTGQTESLLNILKRRYALGEITTAQFEEMRRTLNLTSETDTTVDHAHH